MAILAPVSKSYSINLYLFGGLVVGISAIYALFWQANREPAVIIRQGFSTKLTTIVTRQLVPPLYNGQLAKVAIIGKLKHLGTRGSNCRVTTVIGFVFVSALSYRVEVF